MDDLAKVMSDVESATPAILSGSIWTLIIELIALLVLAYIGFIVTKGKEKSLYDGVLSKANMVFSWGKSNIGLVRQVIDNIFRSQEWKYEKPWYLVIGSEESKSGYIVDSMVMRLGTKYDGAQSVPKLSGGKIVFLNNGVLVTLSNDDEPDEEKADSPEDRKAKSEADSKTYSQQCKRERALVGELIQVRPQRALDGILLVVSAKELERDRAKESDRFTVEIADRIRAIQKQVEFSFPVYLLISETNEFVEFGHFWSAQKRGVDRQQAFGWRPAEASDLAFKEKYLVQALEGISERLNAIQLHAEWVDGERDEIDGFLRFPKKLFTLERPLRLLALQIFNTGYQAKNLLFRGVYFCGRLKGEGNSPNDTSSLGISSFTDKLVDEIIFGSGMQAEPTRKRVLSRNVYVFRFQLLMVIAIFGLFGSLYFSNRHLDSQITSITEVVKVVQGWNTDDLASCEELSSSNEVYSLLANMANLDGRPVYWNIPLSWVETVSSLTDKNLINAGMNNIVLPNVECHLQSQASNLSQVTHFDPNGEAEFDKPLSLSVDGHSELELQHYIRDVIEFESNLYDFLSIVPKKTSFDDGEDPMSVLIRLLETIYREEPPKILRRADGQHKKSLVSQDYPLRWQELYSLSESSESTSLYCQSGSYIRKFDSREPISVALIASNTCLLAERIYKNIVNGSRLITSVGAPVEESVHQYIVEDPHKAYTLINQWKSIASTFEVENGVEFNTPCSKSRLHMQQLTYSLESVYTKEEMKLFEPITDLFSDPGGCERKAKSNIKEVEQALSRIGNNKSANTKKEISVFLSTSEAKRYFHQRAELHPDSAQECKEGISSWDVASLSLAEEYIREYFSLVDENDWHDVTLAESPLKRLALNQLKTVLTQTLYDAQLVEDNLGYKLDILDSVSARESELAETGINFRRAVNHIIPITKDLAALEMNSLEVGLTKCAREYAKAVVNKVHRFSTPLGLYRELPQMSHNLPVNSDFSFTLYNKTDLDDYLDGEYKRTRIVLSYIEAALVLLGETQYVEGYDWQSERPTIAFWRNTLTDFSGFQRELANTQLGALQALYTRLASDEHLCESIHSLPIGGYGYDLFAKRRSQLVVSISALCETQLLEAVSQNYFFIHNEFNQKFENRYPFTRNKNTSEQASARDLREFLISNGGAIKNLVSQTELLASRGKRWSDIHQFLVDLSEIHLGLSGTLAHEPEARPLYLSTTFDLPKHKNLVSSQASVWELATQRYVVSNTDILAAEKNEALSPQLIWRFGDELTFTVHWSKDSPYVVVDEDASERSTSIFSKRFSKTMAGDWALLKLFDTYTADQGRGSSYAKGTLEVQVPLQVAPELVGHTAYQDLGAHSTHASLYLSVQPFAQNDQGVLEPVILPKRFPVFAPPLPGDSYVYH